AAPGLSERPPLPVCQPRRLSDEKQQREPEYRVCTNLGHSQKVLSVSLDSRRQSFVCRGCGLQWLSPESLLTPP
ncbi:MAG: hypothetical protein OXC07_01115, partial [Kistimonas sp.]|nr:hypothetical protein [Kistimonas sp.]